jgi:DNA transposition AAA+ family ATPase
LRVFEDTGHIDDKGNKIKVSHPHPKGGQPISLDNVCDKIKKAKLRAEKVQSLYSVGFLKTSIWERTEWGCLQALKHNRIVFQYGAPQIGKTACAEEFAHQHNGGQTTLVRTPPSGGVQSLLKAVARALHVNAHKCHDDLLQDVIDALDRSKLLIIDEVHEIFITYTKSSVVRCLETLRYIWDQTHCGMVLIGTNVFRNELHEGELMKLMRQLLLRGLREVQHPDVVPDEDLELALESFGLPWPEEAKLLEDFRHLAQDGIGKVMMRLNDGRSVAEKKGLPYTWEHFVTARNVVHKLARGGKK